MPENATINRYLMEAGWILQKDAAEGTGLNLRTIHKIITDEGVRGKTARIFALRLAARLVELGKLPAGTILTPQELDINTNVGKSTGRPRNPPKNAHPSIQSLAS